MRPNEPVEVVIRPEDLVITTPEKANYRLKSILSYSVVIIMKFSPMIRLATNGWFIPPMPVPMMQSSAWPSALTICTSWDTTKLKPSLITGLKVTKIRGLRIEEKLSGIIFTPYVLWLAMFVIAPVALIFIIRFWYSPQLYIIQLSRVLHIWHLFNNDRQLSALRVFDYPICHPDQLPDGVGH